MARYFLALIIALSLFTNCSHFRVKLGEDASASVRLESDGGMCSGSVVSFDGQPYVLTASHCVHGPYTNVFFQNGEVRVFSLVVNGGGRANPQDWAVYAGDTVGVKPLQVAKSMPGKLISATYLAHNRVEHVILTNLTSSGDFGVISYVLPGDSGSPVLNEQGEVVAILHSAYFGSPFGFAAPVWGVIFPADQEMGPQDQAVGF